jgi:hypothetical protein
MAGQATVAGAGGESAVDEPGEYVQPEVVDCRGCGCAIARFSDVRSFCLDCTRVIIEFDVAPRDFAEGCLRDAVESQRTLDDWAVA